MAAHNHIWRGRTPGLTGWAPGCPACPPPVTPRGMPPHPPRRHSGRAGPAWSPHAPEPGIPPRSDDGDRTRPPPLPAPDCPLSSRPHPRKGVGPDLPRAPPAAEAEAAIWCFPQRNSPGFGTNGPIRDRIFPVDETTEPKCRHRGVFVSMSRILPTGPLSTHRVGWRVRRQIWQSIITQYFKVCHKMQMRDLIVARLWLNPGRIARF